MRVFEFWFRKEYEPLLRTQQLTQFVRPGVRLAPEPKGTTLGANVSVRLLDTPGTATSEPVLNSFVAAASVVKLEIKKIADMTDADFEGASPDAASQEGVLRQLEHIYGKSFTADDVVTVFKISYE